MKIGMQLPSTLKNKPRNTNLKFDLDPQKSLFLVFKENLPKKNFFVFRLWFSFKNNRHTNVLLVGILKTPLKKSYWLSKMPFWLFVAVNNVFLCAFKNTDQNSICASTVLFLKQKEKKNMKTNSFFTVFISNSKNALFGGSTNFFSNFVQF